MSARRQNQDLAAAAQSAARRSGPLGRKAWLCCSVALSESSTPDAARGILAEMVEDDGLRILALACLATLCSDGPPAAHPGRQDQQEREDHQVQGDSWRDAIALIETYQNPPAGGRTADQATSDRVRILQDCEPREVAIALAMLTVTMLRQLEKRGLDAASLFADVRAAAECGLGSI